jgi:ATP-binding cassette subfamily B protein
MGFLFITLSNYFGVLSPQVTKYVINRVTTHLDSVQGKVAAPTAIQQKDQYETVFKTVVQQLDKNRDFGRVVILCGIVLLLLALLRGFFTFLMRQTIIVMSRHIEYDQKNDIYEHYQKLDTQFYKTNSTGDLMNRISEDVSKVRMFTGPAVMYAINLIALITLSIFYMMHTSPMLTLYTIAPLPLLAFIIYKVNTIINKKSELQLQQLSAVTAMAQESYSGIRVIKSFVQEKALSKVFKKNSLQYKNRAIDLAKTEAWYFPSIALLIGISTLVTIMIGGLYKINHDPAISIGTIAEFVVYINMLTFPVSSIGWVASIIQRAGASQKRINEFLHRFSPIKDDGLLGLDTETLSVQCENVSFTYTDTKIKALQQISFTVPDNYKVAIVGKTGSGKSTLIQILLRLYEPDSGTVCINQDLLQNYRLAALRSNIAYVPQEAFLFSDTISGNIGFGNPDASETEIRDAARSANIYEEIMQFKNGFNTLVGERGVTLSGGQKQRISIARALLKNSKLYLFDDCLSAVDLKTEHAIINDIRMKLINKTAIFVTHRIYSSMNFDTIFVLENGALVESGKHEELLQRKGYYYQLYQDQHVNR